MHRGLVGGLIGRWLECPPLPRRITYKIVEAAWHDALFRGAVAATVCQDALLLAAFTFGFAVALTLNHFRKRQ